MVRLIQEIDNVMREKDNSRLETDGKWKELEEKREKEIEIQRQIIEELNRRNVEQNNLRKLDMDKYKQIRRGK